MVVAEFDQRLGRKPSQYLCAAEHPPLLDERDPAQLARRWTPMIVIRLAALVLAAVGAIPAPHSRGDGPGRHVVKGRLEASPVASAPASFCCAAGNANISLVTMISVAPSAFIGIDRRLRAERFELVRVPLDLSAFGPAQGQAGWQRR